jgi:hypothetical protein
MSERLVAAVKWLSFLPVPRESTADIDTQHCKHPPGRNLTGQIQRWLYHAKKLARVTPSE